MGDDMARDGLIMVAFGMLAGLFNYLYQISMGILLSPEDFATLFSLFSLFMVVWWFPQALQTPITKFVSTLRAHGDPGGIRRLWQSSLRRTLLLGVATFAVFVAASPAICSLLNIDNSAYAVVVFASFVVAFPLPVNFGVLRGLQRFVPLGFSNALWAFLRLFLGIFLVYVLGMGLWGAVAPLVLAPAITLLASIYLLKGLPRFGSQTVQFSTFRSYTGYSVLALIAFAIATNGDVILAKHFLGAEEAGAYAVISVLGKVALIAPAGIAVAMFPKTSENFETGRAHKPLLQKAMLAVLLIGGGTVLFYMLFPDFIIKVILGGKYAILPANLVEMGLGMLCFSLCFVLLNYFLSLNRVKGVAFCILAAMALQFGLIWFFHANIDQFLGVMLVTGAASLVLLLGLYLTATKAFAPTQSA
jgi:O-antigen/teichoic acid export membrane protein